MLSVNSLLKRFNSMTSPLLSFLDTNSSSYSPYATGIISIFLISYAALAAPKLPRNVIDVLAGNPLVKVLFMAAIIWLFTNRKNPALAILIAVCFIVTVSLFEKYKMNDVAVAVQGEIDAQQVQVVATPVPQASEVKTCECGKSKGECDCGKKDAEKAKADAEAAKTAAEEAAKAAAAAKASQAPQDKEKFENKDEGSATESAGGVAGVAEVAGVAGVAVEANNESFVEGSGDYTHSGCNLVSKGCGLKTLKNQCGAQGIDCQPQWIDGGYAPF